MAAQKVERGRSSATKRRTVLRTVLILTIEIRVSGEDFESLIGLWIESS